MIRPLDSSDLEALLALDAATNPHPWTAAQWQDSLVQHLCLGLELAGRLAAFAVAMPLPDEAELLLIAVDPAQQRHGSGRTLLAGLRAELAARQCEKLFLEVRESNTRARHFYAAAGMEEIGRRKNYYPAAQGREDALLLAGATRC
ncbi:ribosomal-protein-alanine N-acetyltransferase [Formivibrio citricus]|uniref:[Ribosomal protein bS18]-alanine N-acetyltransferase n=1 Tax=Formivibrio citricus TaxID=83765 RepID=A0A1I4WKP9_9NEIS|nr:ribosomal protein S18-alanine N-acetyltransferase [Formivibrio citricus]SFN14047.1 ribosomal-protein-alanine N-acetyltransferase [Formivibrio citricus]